MQKQDVDRLLGNLDVRKAMAPDSVGLDINGMQEPTGTADLGNQQLKIRGGRCQKSGREIKFTREERRLTH